MRFNRNYLWNGINIAYNMANKLKNMDIKGVMYKTMLMKNNKKYFS